MVNADSLSFKNQINRLLADSETIDVEFVTTPRNITGMFFLEQLIPILKEKHDIINFTLTFPTQVNESNISTFENETDEVDMYHLMAVKEVYPEKYYDFLQNWTLEILTENNDIFAIYKRLDMKFLLVLQKSKELHSINEIENHRIVVATKLQTQMPIVKLNTVIAEFPSAPFGGPLCCDFFQCLQTRMIDEITPNGPISLYNNIKDLLKAYKSCAACLYAPNPVSCGICAGALGLTALEKIEAFIKIIIDCKVPGVDGVCFGGVISCESVDGKDFFCNDDVNFLFQDKPNGIEFFSYPVAECLECPTLDVEDFGIQIGVSTSGAIPQPKFTIKIYKGTQILPIDQYNIGDSTFLDFEEYNPTIGDIFCIELFAEGCPNNGQRCFTYQGPCATSNFSFAIPQINPPSTCGVCDGYIGFKGSWNSNGHVTVTANGEPTNEYGAFDNLCGGKYTLIATDEGTGCSIEFTVNLEDKTSPEILGEVKATCVNENIGSIIAWVAPVEGEYGDYTFDFASNNGLEYCIEGLGCELTELPAGNYCITVTNNINGCSSEKCFDVVELSSSGPLTITIEPTGIAKTCRQENTGKFFYSVSGGVAPYGRAVLNTEGRNIAGQLFTHLPKGDNCITITDYCGESTTECVHIERTDPIEYIVTVKNTCLDKKGNDLKTGNISITGDYKLEIKNGANGQLGQGSHTIVVTDETGCSTDEVVQIGTSELTNCHPDPENCQVELCDCEGVEVIGGDLPTIIKASPTLCYQMAEFCSDGKTLIRELPLKSNPVSATPTCACELVIKCINPVTGVSQILETIPGITSVVPGTTSGTGTTADPFTCPSTTFCNFSGVFDINNAPYRYKLFTTNTATVGPGVNSPKGECKYALFCDNNGNGTLDSDPTKGGTESAFDFVDRKDCKATNKPVIASGSPCTPRAPLIFDYLTNKITAIREFDDGDDQQYRKIRHQNKNIVKIFPNPTTSIINIEVINNSEELNYKIYNSQGKLVKNGQLINQHNKVDFNPNKVSGLYIINILNDGKLIESKKIIFQ